MIKIINYKNPKNAGRCFNCYENYSDIEIQIRHEYSSENKRIDSFVLCKTCVSDLINKLNESLNKEDREG